MFIGNLSLLFLYFPFLLSGVGLVTLHLWANLAGGGGSRLGRSSLCLSVPASEKEFSRCDSKAEKAEKKKKNSGEACATFVPSKLFLVQIKFLTKIIATLVNLVKERRCCFFSQ